MTNLGKNDFDLLEKLISLNQNQTKDFVLNLLKKDYSNIIDNEYYIIGEGEIPVALVSHMDTVFEEDDNERDKIFYDEERDVLWHPYGAGFDDKAGVFSIFKIIKSGLRPHVIFTTDEEIGSLGAETIVFEHPEFPFGDLKYLIELDRANDNDCVFYNCENYRFEDYVNSFGFETAFGTSSDITRLCPQWDVAGVNLSVGYKYEHTSAEILNVDAMLSTVSKVKDMLNDAENLNEPFEYKFECCDF